jgi:hypothetical protein
MRHPLLLLVLLAGCHDATKVPAADDTDSDTTADDTAPDTDTATDTDPDTAADTDTGTDTDPDFGAPNTGDIVETVSVGARENLRLGGVADLDGDGMDEILLTSTWGQLWIARIDAHARTGGVGLVDGVASTSAWPVGNGQVVVYEGVDDGTSVATLTPVRDGWEATKVRLDHELLWAVPAGDLDGDGITDVLLRYAAEYGADLVVVRGPLAAPLAAHEIARITGWADTHATGTSTAVSTADVDGDGADDLLTVDTELDALRIVYGPLAVGTTGSLADLAGTTIPLDEGLIGSNPGVVDDLDGDGTREVAVGTALGILIYDGLVPGLDAAVPEHVIPAYRPATVGGPLRALVAVIDGEAAWWTAPPVRGAWRPDATVAWGGVFGRFGGPEASDYAWLTSRSLHAAPGWSAALGDDLDRDGFGAADDCDDADPARRPEAPERGNGVDDDCDGAVDETMPVDPVLTQSWTGDRNDQLGQSVAVWGDSGGTGLVVSRVGGVPRGIDPVTGAATDLDLFDGGVASFGAAGDMDGDGLADLLATSGRPDNPELAVLFGPAAAAEVAYDEPRIQYIGPVAAVGDLDGDGLTEGVVTGVSYASEDEWLSQLVVARVDPSRALAFETVDGLRGDPVGPVDLDGDGYDDLLLADGGTASFRLGPIVDGALAARPEDGTFVTGGTLRAGDIDGDGRADLAVSSWEHVVSVAHGPWGAAAWDLRTEADAVLSGPAGFVGVAWAPGEWLFVAAPTADRGAGRVLGFPLPLAATVTEDDATLRVDGALPRAAAGSALVTADLDGDGVLDLVVSSPDEAAALDDEGVVRIYALP